MSLDEFREAGAFLDDEQKGDRKRAKRGSGKPSAGGGGDTFLGMTAPQRFILALIILLTVCLVSTFILILTERVVPPGLM